MQFLTLDDLGCLLRILQSQEEFVECHSWHDATKQSNLSSQIKIKILINFKTSVLVESEKYASYKIRLRQKRSATTRPLVESPPCPHKEKSAEDFQRHRFPPPKRGI